MGHRCFGSAFFLGLCMTAAHSKWSASGFEQRMLCPGSYVLQAGKPDNTSKYAAEGTAAHQVLTWALQEDRPASAFIGRVIESDGFTFEVDEDMARHVQVTKRLRLPNN